MLNCELNIHKVNLANSLNSLYHCARCMTFDLCVFEDLASVDKGISKNLGRDKSLDISSCLADDKLQRKSAVVRKRHRTEKGFF